LTGRAISPAAAHLVARRFDAASLRAEKASRNLHDFNPVTANRALSGRTDLGRLAMTVCASSTGRIASQIYWTGLRSVGCRISLFLPRDLRKAGLPE
jgi:hypothetical protein